VGPIEASLVDIGNAHVFIRARDIGLTGTETAADIDRNADLLARLERIRGCAAHRMAMVSSPENARAESPATPILGIISPPADYTAALSQREVTAGEVDLVSRLLFMQQAHKTYAGTSTVCTGIAARLDGTIVHEAVGHAGRNAPEVRIGHPAGVIETQVSVDATGPHPVVRRATLGRTARRIMEGYTFVPDDVTPTG